MQQVRGLIEVLGTKFHVEDAVRGSAGGSCESSTAVAGGRLVRPIRSHNVRGCGVSERRAGDIGAVIGRPKGQLAVRSGGGSRKELVIQENRERQCDCRAAVIAMIADISVTRHENTTTQRERVRRRASWRWRWSGRGRRCRSRCRGECSCSRGCRSWRRWLWLLLLCGDVGR